MKIFKIHSMLKLANSYLNDSAQPSNYAWNFGSLLAVFLGILIATGVTLALNYIKNIMIDVNSGWIRCYLHSNAIPALTFWSLLAVFFGIQVVTGVTFTWNPVKIIMVGAYSGWILRYFHLNTAPAWTFGSLLAVCLGIQIELHYSLSILINSSNFGNFTIALIPLSTIIKIFKKKKVKSIIP